MSNLLFSADTHFGHERMAKEFRAETFLTAEEHDEAIIERWNKEVHKNDTVFLLGDVSLKHPDVFGPFVRRLNGTIHLVSGNHDQCWPGHRDAYKMVKPYMDAGFETVQPFLRKKIDGKPVLMSHFPYSGDHVEGDRASQYRLRDEGIPLLHGHTHQRTIISHSTEGTFQLHVGLDSWGLRPVHLEEIVNLLRF